MDVLIADQKQVTALLPMDEAIEVMRALSACSTAATCCCRCAACWPCPTATG